MIPKISVIPSSGTQFLGYISSDPKVGRNKAGVYCIFNTKTNRMYVGSAMNLTSRWSGHKHALRNGKHHSKHLQRSWAKHGESAFEFRIITFIDKVEELRAFEQKLLNSSRPLYNSTWAVSNAMSPDIREKLSKSMRGRNNPFYAKKHTKETRQLMREHHADVSGENNPMFGVSLNGEKNPMWGRQRPDTADFNTRTKKGRTWEDMYGVERAAQMRQKASERMKGNTRRRDT